MAPAQTFKFLWVLLWIFPSTGKPRQFGAAPALAESPAPEQWEEAVPVCSGRKFPFPTQPLKPECSAVFP